MQVGDAVKILEPFSSGFPGEWLIIGQEPDGETWSIELPDGTTTCFHEMYLEKIN